MGGSRAPVRMAVEAVYGAGIVVGDELLHGRLHGSDSRIDVAGGVVASGAKVRMGGQDVRPALDRVTGGAGLRVDLTEVGGRINGHRVVDNAAG